MATGGGGISVVCSRRWIEGRCSHEEAVGAVGVEDVASGGTSGRFSVELPVRWCRESSVANVAHDRVVLC